MKHCTTIDSLRQARAGYKQVGFVPTMGFLHEGHLSLVRQARAENEAVIVSIFVNPAQFGPHEDFASYPRDLQRDMALLAREGVDLVFTPEASEFYPPAFATRIEVGGVATRFEGALRPGHFSGVATVVTKLFNIVQPQKAYFGQKDAQQCAVIKRFVEDLNIPVEIMIVPTGREQDGLACSSRNVRLSEEERALAPGLYKALEGVQRLFQSGQRDCKVLESRLNELLQQNNIPQPDYAVIIDPQSFETANPVTNDALALVAVPFGTVRLIDNLPLGMK